MTTSFLATFYHFFVNIYGYIIIYILYSIINGGDSICVKIRVSVGKSTRWFFARQVAGRRCEEIRKFGKSFSLRFTAWIRLSARHFADDESTTLVQELLLRVRDDTTKPKDGYARGRRDSEIRIRKDSARFFSSFSFFLDKASQDRKRQKEGEKEKEVEEEEEEKKEGSPEALIVSEFRVDGNPQAVLHPPAFLPRSLNIRTRLSYVTAAKEEEQKYENARKTRQAIARERERGEKARKKEIGEVRSLKRFSVRSKQIELLRFWSRRFRFVDDSLHGSYSINSYLSRDRRRFFCSLIIEEKSVAKTTILTFARLINCLINWRSLSRETAI